MICQAGALSETELHVYADADLASCVHTARSTSGMMIFLFALADRMELATPNISRSFDNRGRNHLHGWSHLLRGTAAP